MNIQHVGVAGFGYMGQAIAYWLASVSVGVTVITRRVPEECHEAFELLLSGYVARAKIKPDFVESIRSRIQIVSLLNVKNVDWIVECLEEELEAKRNFFLKIPREYNGIVSTNTSTLSPAKLVKYVPKAANFLGTHFFRPVIKMPLIELVPTINTNPVIIRTIENFLKSKGKSPLVVPDIPGFIVNRILFAALCKAMKMLEKKEMSAMLIDSCMTMGCAWPMGPLALADYIGLDICLRIIERLVQDETFPYSTVPEHLVKLVSLGRLGKKTKKGFYDYD